MSLSISFSDDYIGYLTYSSKHDVDDSSTLVCALDIPAFLVPNELIAFFESYLIHMESIKILRSPIYEKIEFDNNGFSDTTYVALLSMKSNSLAKKIVSEFDGRPYSTLDLTVCKLIAVISVVYTERKIADNTDLKSNANVELEFLYRRMADTAENRLPIASAMDKDDYTETKFNEESLSIDILCEDDPICVVCLESLRTENMVPFTMYCGHTFHCSCVTRLEPPQCPVCRFEHDMNSCLLTECITCGWNGLPTVLSQIRSPSLSIAQTASVLEVPFDRDIWVCLVCGYTGCGLCNAGHIQMHYDSQQHAYAMNTDTRHVFDFAGQGYVHRLVVQQDAVSSSSSIPTSNSSNNINAVASVDNSVIRAQPPPSTITHNTNADNGTQVRAKLFEVNDPNYVSAHRPSRAPLTTDEEERSVSLKLEMIAQQHSTLLAREMATQRQHYEESIAKIRGFMQDEAAHLYQNVADAAHLKSSHTASSSAAVSGSQTKSNSKSCHRSNYSSTNSDDTSKCKDEESAIMAQWLLRVEKRLAQDKQKALKQLEATKAKVVAKENEYEGNCCNSIRLVYLWLLCSVYYHIVRSSYFSIRYYCVCSCRTLFTYCLLIADRAISFEPWTQGKRTGIARASG